MIGRNSYDGNHYTAKLPGELDLEELKRRKNNLH